MKLYFLLIISIISLCVNAQTKLDLAIENLEENYAQEKVYILLNKEDYIAGENIWFKAFVFNGYKQSNISSNLFVELYDKNKTLIDKKLLPIISGQSDGSFTLKDNLEENVYYIRAYTTYMTYFSEDFQYIKPLLIYNPNSKLKLVKNDNLKWNASVYPEGGTFIENQTTKFAVRLKSVGDLPKKWNGFVFEKNNPSTKIIEFNNLDENIALFNLRAESNKSYQLQINDENGNQQNIDLPIAKKNGVSFIVIDEGNEISYQLKSTGMPQQLIDYKVVGIVNNTVVYTAKLKKDVQNISQKILKTRLSEDNGVLQLYVFDAKDNVVAQRLVFINHNKTLSKPILNFDTNNETRTINTVTSKSETPQILAAVINDATNHTDDFLSSLWLTKDFTDNISNPIQYFQKGNSPDALDALLISEEWKRYNWQDLMNNSKKVPNINLESYLSYKGKAYINGQDLKNSDLNLFIENPETEKILIPASTDSNGNFELKNLISYDDFNIFYYLNNQSQKSKKEDSKVVLSILPLLNHTKFNSSFPTTNYILKEVTSNENQNESKAHTEQIKINKIVNDKSIRLKEAFVRAQTTSKTEKLNKELSSPLFQGINETVLDFVNDNKNANTYSNILEYLLGRVSGLTTEIKEGVLIYKLRNSEVKFYIDEIKVPYETVSSININDVAMVKVYKGNGLIWDAIAFYYKKGDMIERSPSKSLNVLSIKGYDKSVSFLSNDDYETLYKDIPNDNRKTIYWNPNLISEPNKKTIIEYYNNDKPKDYQLTMIGFDEKGNPVYYEGKIN
ncbi:hypothetical protein HXZ94_02820 [Empedobacter falsenii]|uniref:hypothetical protein n=1 Tax=Empedobacter falsenii TaxID=343874 RepID=UPI002576F00E|nr:hypothetical protein [Empedobacter falsenii]MDM1297443.1 hypothetical protein [Empedobacter falsenii]MDM1317237.1 hypothetical protein [Empedobacter falsenii]